MAAEPRPPIGATRARSKVVGLGAPISVRIVLEPFELSVFRAAIDEEVTGYTTRAEPGASSQDRNGDGWDDHTDELARMRADLDGAAEREVVVVWPTVLAYGVVRRAVELAERRAEADGSHTAWAALAAAARTRSDFDAVDAGGLEAVWL